MFKKINILLVLLLLLVSITAVSAAEDLNDTVIASDEAIADTLNVYGETEVVSSDDSSQGVLASTTHTINVTNYGTYFNSKGDLISNDVNDGDTIEIGEDFNGKKFTFQKSLNVIAKDDVKLTNCMFTFSGSASGSVISNLNIHNTNEITYGIFLNGVSNCKISNCFINNTGASSYAICVANDANHNNITDNSLNAYGITYGHGTRSTTPLLISGAHYNYIANNDISCDDANAIYLSSYSGGPLKGGESNFNLIYNNTVKYNVLPTSWAYGVQLMGQNNTVKYNKIIGAYLGISGGIGSIIINNTIINVSGADFNHPGVPVGGQGAIGSSANSIVRGNTIVNAKIASTGAGITVSDNCIVENNYVEIKDTAGVGIQSSGSNITVNGNTIITYTGSGITNGKTQNFNLTLTNNKITSNSGVGVLIQKLSSKKMPGNITVTRNTIETTNRYAIDISEADAAMYYYTKGNTIRGSSIVLDPAGEFDPSKYNYEFNGKTVTITPENYDDYINENGGLKNISDGDILSFSGVFSNKYIYLNSVVKVTGNNPIFNNTTFRVSSDGVWIEKLTINNNRAERINAWGVLVYQITGATILNCTISVYDPNAAYAIYALESNQVDIINNTLSSEGKYLTYTILANTLTDSNIINNTIFTNGTDELYTFEAEHCLEGDSVCTDGNTVCPDGNTVCPEGDEVCPEGSSVCLEGNSVGGSHVLKEVYRTYGILMVYSSDNIVSRNKVTVTSKLNQTYSTYNSTNSIVGIDLYYNSHYNVFSENTVHVYGNDNYIYGMGVLGYYTTMIAPEGQGAENNQFINNNILVEGTYFVTGIIVGSSSDNTKVIGNLIDGKCTNVSYGITLEVSQKSLIENNNITLNSEIIYGLEGFDSNSNIINNNKFEIEGKQAYGFVISRGKYNEINSNFIFINITDDGFEVINISTKNYDTIVGGNAGIYLRSVSTNNSIENNNITTLKGYAVIIDDDAINNIISNNYLSSANGTGNNAVNNTVNNVVKDNYVYLVVGTLSDVNIKYFENGTFKFTTDDTNLNGAKIEFIDDYGNIINVGTISNGEATFIYDFDGFKDHTPGVYMFSARIYKENYKVTDFDCYVFVNDGDLIVSVDNVTGAVARNADFLALIKNILGEGVSGITVEFYVIDEGFLVYVGKAVSDQNGLAALTAQIPTIYDENPVVLADIKDPYHFNPASARANLTAYWLTNTKMTMNTNVYPGANLAILKDANGNVLSNKQVTIKIGTSTYTRTTNSAGAVAMPTLSRGSYSVSVAFAGDDDYYESTVNGKVTVLPSLSENKDSSVYYGNTINYKVRVKGSDGKYSAGKLVTIKVNGKTYSVNMDKNGYATKALKLKAGSYTITAEFNGDKVSNKLTFKPTLTAKNIVKKKAKKIKFTVKVVNKNGKAVKKKKVTFKIKGKKYTAKTNKKGVATVNIKNLKVGKFTITSSYGGCTIKNAIKIKK